MSNDALYLSPAEALQVAADQLERIPMVGGAGQFLDMRGLVEHLKQLAVLVAAGSITAATTLHQEFSVVPHAKWLATAAAKARSHDSYKNAGRLGGASRSGKKAAASRANGRKGGRPRFDHDGLVDRFIRFARDPNATKEVLGETIPSPRTMPKVSARLRRKLLRRLRVEELAPSKALWGPLICAFRTIPR